MVRDRFDSGYTYTEVKMKKKLVIKIGTSTLTQGSSRISFGLLERLASQCQQLSSGYDIVIVSSGAIAAARHTVSFGGKNKQVDSKQALSAIGQPKLMYLYDRIFGSFGLDTAQCLLTYRDFSDDHTLRNTQNTINKLVESGFIPIINENDTVAIEEIILGDNDKLSAYVAVAIEADLLIIASDIDGLYDKNPHAYPDAKLITEVTDLDEVSPFAQGSVSGLGTGGMTTKLQAAKICAQKQLDMWIVNGFKPNFVIDALNGETPFTAFKFR